MNDDELKTRALANAEQNGIVFLDEIDKITSRAEMQGADVSRQGVQRDLLPLVEGTTVSTRYGMVKTDHILFIASGAFHLAKPSGPDPRAARPLSDPGRARLALDRRLRAHPRVHRRKPGEAVPGPARHRGRDARVPPEAIRRLAEIAFQVNESTENIGARRLYTVLEKLLEEISFDAGKRGAATVAIDAAYVDARLAEPLKNEDLARFVL